ncbi:uncharacterized protein LOC110740272 [Chenopodium quinoa]|uniref:uncharacterized protein LOC110740272 n=1 Tax=Chenopodium quinoa TaxID=63459 RepID=UPI000B773E31|nr:uncharacterized protein LOC110740272 [Chenopodium quinoa]
MLTCATKKKVAAAEATSATNNNNLEAEATSAANNSNAEAEASTSKPKKRRNSHSHPQFSFTKHPLSSGSHTILNHKGTEPEGVKWGEYWANGAADDTTARKWVVAFDTTAGKAYIEAGPMGPVDWNVVEVKLIMSRCISKHTYPILGGNVLAAIDGFKAYAEFR